jgi:hypothetical protein
MIQFTLTACTSRGSSTRPRTCSERSHTTRQYDPLIQLPFRCSLSAKVSSFPVFCVINRHSSFSLIYLFAGFHNYHVSLFKLRQIESIAELIIFVFVPFSTFFHGITRQPSSDIIGVIIPISFWTLLRGLAGRRT